jgi:hypothetical protein
MKTISDNNFLIKEWDYIRNKGISPSDIPLNYENKVWWLCNRGHSYESTPKKRMQGRGCSRCNRNYSFLEVCTYIKLSKLFVTHFQYNLINKKTLDILIENINGETVAIEMDSYMWHKGKKEKDLAKNLICFENNYRLIRIRDKRLEPLNDSSCSSIVLNYDKNDNCYTSVERAICFIINEINGILHTEIPTDFSYDMYLEALEFKFTKHVSKSLVEVNPAIANQWHPQKNGILKVINFPAHSRVTVWWLCEKGHEWQQSIGSRVGLKGCGICSGQTVIPETSVASTHSWIIDIWNNEKNRKPPTEIGAGSSQYVHVRYLCGHEEYNKLYRILEKNSVCKECEFTKSKCFINTHFYIFDEMAPTGNEHLENIFYKLTSSSKHKVVLVCSSCKGTYIKSIRDRARRSKHNSFCDTCNLRNGKVLRKNKEYEERS